MKTFKLLFFLTLFFLPFQPILKNGWASFYITDVLYVCLIGVGVLAYRGNYPSLFFEGEKKYAVALLLCTLASAVLAGEKGLVYWKWVQFALPFLAYFFVTTLIREKSVFRIVCWILVGLSLLEVGVALSQYGMQHAVGLKSLGESKLTTEFSASIKVMSKNRWIFGWPNHTVLLIRPVGTFPHPNILGGFLGICTLATSFLYLEKKRWVLLAVLALQIFGVFLTFSRGALFGMLGSFVLLLLFSRKGISLGIAMALFVCGSGLLLKEQILDRGGVVNQTQYSVRSNQFRLEFQSTAANLGKERPFIGQGFGTYESRKGETLVHNIYLLLFAESGVLGLGAFLAFLASLGWMFLKKETSLERSFLLAAGAFIVWFGMVDHYWLTTPHGRGLLMSVAVLMGAQRVNAPKGEKAPLPI